jgi:hypothetical protein
VNLNWSLLQSRESAELVGGLAAALEAVAAASADYEPEGISGVDGSGLAEGAKSIQKSRLAVLTNVNPSPPLPDWLCEVAFVVDTYKITNN